MAICMIVQFAGMKADKYEAVNHELDFWKNGPPEGNLSHTAGGNAEGWYVVDVWESQDHWDRFLNDRLKPPFDKVSGIPQPRVTTFNVHNRMPV